MSSNGSRPAAAAADRETGRTPVARLRLGAVEYLNARPLVFGLERSPRFEVRYDVPSRCAALLHAGDIDLGLIPAIEYLRAPRGTGAGERREYCVVPGVAIASRGPVASVALYTTRPAHDVRSIALDTSSRSSVALARVLCRRHFRIDPEFVPHAPDLGAMLSRCDAAVLIGDEALLLDGGSRPVGGRMVHVEKIDLGAAWTDMTGLPFVYAFWAGPRDVVGTDDVRALWDARDEGTARPDVVAGQYFPGSAARQAIGTRYLRENIRYGFGDDEREGLELFFRYAYEAGVVDAIAPLRFFEGP